MVSRHARTILPLCLGLILTGCPDATPATKAQPRGERPRAGTKPASSAPTSAAASTGDTVDPKQIIRRSEKGVFLIAYRVPLHPDKARVVSKEVAERLKKQGALKNAARAKKTGPLKKGPWILLCTAFTYGKRTLATTGECVYYLQMALAKKVDYFIAQNRGLSRAFRVVETHLHSAYCHKKVGLKHDLGLIEVDRDLGAPLPVASAEELKQVKEKDVVYYYGFLAEATPDVKVPVATMFTGKVARLTNTEFFEKAPLPGRVIIHHDALANKGTSGSPIFSTAGKVIGVQAGAHHFPLDLKAVAKTSKHTKRYSYGVRIDQMKKVTAE